MPWFSPRYLGHMNADTLLGTNLAYMATILYNPNNVAYESAPATTELELEVGEQFASVFGYDADRAWGHITADGTIANYEGLRIARNLTSVPPAVRDVRPDLLETRDECSARGCSDAIPERPVDELGAVDRQVRRIDPDVVVYNHRHCIEDVEFHEQYPIVHVRHGASVGRGEIEETAVKTGEAVDAALAPGQRRVGITTSIPTT